MSRTIQPEASGATSLALTLSKPEGNEKLAGLLRRADGLRGDDGQSSEENMTTSNDVWFR